MASEELATTTAIEAEHLCTHRLGVDKKTEEPILCNKPAVFAYTWAWGESGKCCREHQFILNQISEQTARSVGFVPLDAGIKPAIETDERIQFNARILTAEQERDTARARGLELFETNTKLAAEGRLLMAQLNEANRKLAEEHGQRLELEKRNGQLLSQNAEYFEEVERLRAFLPSEDHG